MAGLDPAIHVLLLRDQDVDARVKPGHDGSKFRRRQSRHCLQQTRSVCARERSDEAIQPFLVQQELDCFASLAMTAVARTAVTPSLRPDRVRGALDEGL